MSSRMVPIGIAFVLGFCAAASADEGDVTHSVAESRHSAKEACGAYERLRYRMETWPNGRIAAGAIGSAIGSLIDAGATRILRNHLLYFKDYAFFRSDALVFPAYGAFERGVLKHWSKAVGYTPISQDVVLRLTPAEIRAFNYAFLQEMERHLRAQDSETAHKLIRALIDRKGQLAGLLDQMSARLKSPAKVRVSELLANAKGYILEKFVVRDPSLARAVLKFSTAQLGEAAGGLTGRCVRYGAKLLKWGGIVSGVAADLFMTSPVKAGTVEEAYRFDPSHLFDEGVTAQAACKRLEGDEILRTRFMILADAMEAGERQDEQAQLKKAYGDDSFCGGPADEQAREEYVKEMVATGAYRRAKPEDFGSPKEGEDANAKRVRAALAKAVGVVPAR